MDSIQIKLTTAERDLILEHTFAGNDLTDRIKLAELKGKHILASYTLEDLDELGVLCINRPKVSYLIQLSDFNRKFSSLAII
jgi:hypothetical protein